MDGCAPVWRELVERYTELAWLRETHGRSSVKVRCEKEVMLEAELTLC